MWSRVLRFSVSAAALLVGAGAAQGADIDPALAERMRSNLPGRPLPVIVHLRAQLAVGSRPEAAAVTSAAPGARILAALTAHARATQAPLLDALSHQRAQHVQPLVLPNAVAAQVTAADIRSLAARPDVARIEYDLTLTAPVGRASAAAANCQTGRASPRTRMQRGCQPYDSTVALQPGVAFDIAAPVAPQVARSGAPAAWQAGLTGRGVTVAVVDSGLDAASASIAASLRTGPGGWFDAHGQHARPTDLHGHGTQIASLITGTHAGGATLGSAPQVRLIGARIYNDEHRARLSDVHRALAWLLDPDGNPATDDAPQIVLNAWGLTDRVGQCDTGFSHDIAWLRAAGMHVVFAAGNSGPGDGTSLSPANNSGALAVGASDATGAPARFSSRGPSACDARPYPDVAMQGMDLRVADRSAGGLSSFATVDGSSFAAALAAAQLALIVQARPDATLAEREALLTTAQRQAGGIASALAVQR